MDRATPESAEKLLKEAAPYKRIWLILTPATTDAWRDPKGLIKKALDHNFTTKGDWCFACDGGDPVKVTLYDRVGEDGRP